MPKKLAISRVLNIMFPIEKVMTFHNFSHKFKKIIDSQNNILKLHGLMFIL